MVIIYVDGVFDLFHVGHLRFLQKCKSLMDNVYLIVGIVNDKDCVSYKRLPIIGEKDRAEIVKNIQCVDQILENAPLRVTRDFLEQHRIDFIAHAFSSSQESEFQMEHFFQDIRDRFIAVPYTSGISTSCLIQKIKLIES